MSHNRTKRTKAELIEELQELRRTNAELKKRDPSITEEESSEKKGAPDNTPESLLTRPSDLLEKMFANIHVLIALMDSEFRFIRVNKAYATHAGYSPEYFVGKNHFDLYPNPENEAIFRHTVETGEAYHAFERAFTYPDSPEEEVTYWDWTLQPIKGDDGQVIGLMLSLIDVTDQKRAHQELARYAEMLEQSNKELEDFAFVASHDLQEPLRKIQAFGSRLKTKYAELLGGEGSDYLRRMLNACTRMQSLLDALLAYSRVTTKGRPFTKVAVNDVIHEALSNLENLLDECRGEVYVEELPSVDADPYQLVQLFQNLVGNAVKFRHKNSRPWVRIRANMAKSPEVEKDAGTEEAGVCKIEVEDNGIGFHPRYSDRIFLSFQRLHGRGEYEGTGMGLTICRKIVERHGGNITAESTPGKGSKFIVTLPLRQSDKGC